MKLVADLHIDPTSSDGKSYQDVILMKLIKAEFATIAPSDHDRNDRIPLNDSIKNQNISIHFITNT